MKLQDIKITNIELKNKGALVCTATAEFPMYLEDGQKIPCIVGEVTYFEKEGRGHWANFPTKSKNENGEWVRYPQLVFPNAKFTREVLGLIADAIRDILSQSTAHKEDLPF